MEYPLITIEDLNPTDSLSGEFVVPAMRDGLSYKLTVAQILGLLIDGATGSLDTLNELAASLGNDANFASTVTALIGSKLNALQPQETVASAATVDLASIASADVYITGSNGIASFGSGQDGMTKFLRFSGTLPLTHSAALILPNGGQNIVTAPGDACWAKSLGSGNWVVTEYQRASGIGVIGSRGRTIGLTLANDTGGDVTNDIIIAAGSAPSDTSPYNVITLASSLTKRLDAAWAVGTGNGGWLDGASMPDGWGFAFIIGRSDTGVADVGFSASPSAPPLPANYDRKQIIGAIFRTGGAIKAFTQYGRNFVWNEVVSNISTGSPSTTGAILTVTAPPLVGVRARLGLRLSNNASAFAWVRETTSDNVVPTAINTDAYFDSANGGQAGEEIERFVDASGQVRYRSSVGTIGGFGIVTKGFAFPR